jgi:FkbM family methyltransferase
MGNTYASIAARILRSAGARPVCLDVGSAGGFHPRLEAIRSEIDIVGFDADPDECARLNAAAAPGERHINAAIGRDGERVVLELHRKRKTSSCYKTDLDRVRRFSEAERFDPDGEVAFTTRSLDSVCAAEDIGRIDYLKADVEGHELAVFEGCTRPFLLAEVEVYFHPFRQGACSFDQIMRHMRERGLMLLDLRRTFWSPNRAAAVRNYGAKGILVFGDALFCLDPFLESSWPALSTAEARARYLALVCLYGYTAEALMFIDVLESRQVMPPEEAQVLRGFITRGAVRRKLRARLGRFLIFIERWLQLPVAVRSGLFLDLPYQADGELGNVD